MLNNFLTIIVCWLALLQTALGKRLSDMEKKQIKALKS